MSMKASARLASGGLRSEVDVNGRHTVVTDEPQRLGGTDQGPAPHELLPAIVASCITTTLAMYARTKQWELGDLRVDVDYDNESTPRRLQIVLHLPSSVSEGQRRRLERVARTCPIRRSLEAGFQFDEEVYVDPAPLDPDSLVIRPIAPDDKRAMV
jgi:putative redox protein